MKMGAGGSSGRTDKADDLALGDMLARIQTLGDAAHMGIGCTKAIAVTDADIIAIGTVISRLFDGAVPGGHDGGAGWDAEIDALVHFGKAQQRVHAHTKA